MESKWKKRVLVVEDDEALALGLEENLKSAGYDVMKARDGNTGFRLGVERHPDLIILDLMLPGMSGSGADHHVDRAAGRVRQVARV